MNKGYNGNVNKPEILLQVSDVNKVFITNKTETAALKNISFEVSRGDILAVVGPSGAGKSTLLHILGTLDQPSSGTVLYKGGDLFSLHEKALADFRNRNIGFVFQFHHLLPEFSALENTMMPALIAGEEKKHATQRARELLTRMGLEKRLDHKQGELSGGEQQRVAVARALIMEPELVLGDEPTGNLDTYTGRDVFNLLLELNQDMGITLIVVTHNEEFSKRMPRCIRLVDGNIVDG